MAVLTWRNVDAPSFRDSADGIRVAGAMFDRAAGNLSQGLGQFQDWRQNQTAGALLNNAQGFTDPEELRKAIASGAVFNGVDRSLVTPQALAALNGQTKALLDQGTTTLTNKGLGVKNEHDILNYPLERARTSAGTANTQANTAQTLQTTDQNARLFPLKFRGEELNNDYKKANIDQTNQTTQFRENLHPIDVANQKLKLREGEFDFGEKVTGVTNNNAATAFSMEAVLGSMTPQDIPHFLASARFNEMNPNAKALALGILQKRYPGVDLLSAANVGSAPPMTGGASTGTSLQAPVPTNTPTPVPTGSAPASAVNNLTGYKPSAFVNSLPFDETRKYVPSILSKTGDLSGLSIYEKAKRIMPHLISTESSNDPNAVNKKTADDRPTGLTQIKPSTFAEMKKNYGIEGSITDPKSNVKAGEMYLKELLTKYNGDPEKALAAYNMGMGNLKTHLDDPKNAQFASNSDESNPATVESKLKAEAGRSTIAAEFALKGLGERIAQNNTSLTRKAETSLFDDKTDMMGAVARLQKNQFYAGTPLAMLKSSIEKLMSMKGKDGNSINAAVAADILEESVIAPNKLERNTFGLLNYSTPDDAAAAEKAKLYLLGDMAEAVKRNIVTNNISEKITAAKDNLEKASAEYSAALKRSPALPDDVIARYRGQVAWANKVLDGVLELQNGDPNQPADAAVNAYRPLRSKPGELPKSPSRVPPPNVRWRGTIPKIPVE